MMLNKFKIKPNITEILNKNTKKFERLTIVIITFHTFLFDQKYIIQYLILAN